MTRTLLALLLVGCSAGVEPAPATTCGWEPQGAGFQGADWDHAEIAAGCGYLPTGVNPCDMTPARRWDNDEAPIVAWRQSPSSECFPVVYLKK